MKHDGAYAWEKLFLAVTTLASSNSDLRSRLADAWHYWPSAGTYDSYLSLKTVLSSEDGLVKKLDRTSDEDVSDLAKRIVSLFNTVARERGI